MPHNPENFNRPPEVTLGEVTLQSEQVPHASLRLASQFAQKFLGIYAEKNQNLELALTQTGLTGQKELRLVRDYFESASRPKQGKGRSVQGREQLKVVKDVLILIKPKIQPKEKKKVSPALVSYPADDEVGDDDY
ncbi:MAG: hypothetical protein V1810_00100 [Candidatus Beckwithbacteria bacterium]